MLTVSSTNPGVLTAAANLRPAMVAKKYASNSKSGQEHPKVLSGPTGVG